MKIQKRIEEYEDIINVPRPVSKKHAPMPLLNRAAQFAPFAALTGYEELIGETARWVGEKTEPGEEQLNAVNRALYELAQRLKEEPSVTLTHFVKDPLKNGGRYVETAGTVKKIVPGEGVLVLKTGQRILFEDILTIGAE